MKKLSAVIIVLAMTVSMAAAAFASEAVSAAGEDPEGYKNGYPIVTIESEIPVQENFAKNVASTVSHHPYEDYQGYIIFYGASNFARWTKMAKDMPEYKVLNQAFGGSTDIDLVHFANEAVFPYNPAIVFFQTGSNDYVNLEGTDEERIEKCMNFKKQMFSAFHEIMPNTKFVVMSGLLLPGRSEYLELTQKINEELKQLADETDYIYFVDAADLTYDGTDFHEELFVKDLIHLNEDGQHLWYEGYIKPAIELVIEENGLDSVRQ